MFTWHLAEHTGTHLDAPLHFSADGASADELTMEQLVVPLVVVDVKEQAAADADYQVSVEDLKAFEAAMGHCPKAAVSPWTRAGARMLPRRSSGTRMRTVRCIFPDFPKEACLYMMEKGVVGMAVDTLSLDHGASKSFDTHYTWLPSGRWGIECLANLDEVPATGATIVVGAPKIRGATGGPSRVLALV